MLLHHSRRETRAPKETLHNDNANDERKFLTIVLDGEVLVLRTLDEDEIGRGKCTTRGCYFGGWKALNQPNGVPEAEQVTCGVKASVDIRIKGLLMFTRMPGRKCPSRREGME